MCPDCVQCYPLVLDKYDQKLAYCMKLFYKIVYISVLLSASCFLIFKPGARRPKAGARLVLEITFVRDVCMCACVCVCVRPRGY